MIKRRQRLLVLVLGLALLGLGACSDDDNPTDPGDSPDTTAPQVVGSIPGAGETAVSVDDTVFVTFSEAMDPDSALGNVTLSSGAVSGSTWYTNRILAVGHADWAEATEVTVTVGTGLADVAGNNLSAPVTFSFWTESSELLLLSSSPAGGAVDVNRDAGILLRFSEDVRPNSVASHVTITDTPAKADYDFTVSEVEDGLVLINPTATLPQSTTITVFVAAGLEAWSGRTLAAGTSFSFTTGVDVDVTPPTIIATDPADGAVNVAADQGYFRMTFSEPVDPDSLQPSAWSFSLFLLMEEMDVTPLWSEGGTVLTVPLPNPLPPGLPLAITFVDFRDLAGNVQTEPFSWRTKVAGSADYVPVVDGARFVDEIAWSRGLAGSEEPVDTDFGTDLVEFQVQGDGSYREASFDDPDFTIPSGNWDAFRKTGSALQWLGFEDTEKGADKASFFDAPLDILPLPLSAGTWQSSTTVTIAGEGNFRADLVGRVIGKSDVTVLEEGGRVFVADAWSVARSMTVEMEIEGEWTHISTETDSVWYAPAYGEIHRISREVDEMDGSWQSEVVWRWPFAAF